MCNKIFLTSLFLVAVFLGLADLALAQEIAPSQDPVSSNSSIPQSAITVATVNIYDAKIIEQKDNVFKLSFDLANRVNVQPEIKYAVALIRQDEQGQTKLDEKIYPEIINLGENQTISKEITYEAPAYLNGEFQLWLFAQNASGLMLAINPLGAVTLSGDSQFLEINSASCYLKVIGEIGDKKYVPRQGVDIKSDEKLSVFCEVINHYDREIAFKPEFKTYWRSTSGRLVEDNKEPQIVVSLRPQEKKELSLILPKAAEPQAYDTVLVLTENGAAVSNSVALHYVLRGDSATIQNVRLDRDYYQKGDIAKVSFVWSAAADAFTNSRFGANPESVLETRVGLSDKNNQSCAQEIDKELVSGKAEEVLSFLVGVDCINPKISVVIKGADGKVLDQKEYTVESKNPTQTKSADHVFPKQYLVYGLIIIIILVIIGLIVFFLKRRAAIVIFLFFLIGFGVFFSGNIAKADSLMGGDINYTASLNKASYLPGEAITVSISASYGGCGNYSIDPFSLFVTVNGISKEFYFPIRINLENGIYILSAYVTDTFVAESTPGNYSAVISYGRWGGTIATIPYTVVAPPSFLTVTKSGTGSGTVLSSPIVGIDCGLYCSSSFPKGASVTLTATPAAGSFFAGWAATTSSSCTGTGTCSETMDTDRNVQAVFTLDTKALTVRNDILGSGSITSSPAGISCGVDCQDQTANFGSGSSVTLTAAAAAGYRFTGWSIWHSDIGYTPGMGDPCTDGATTCNLSMTQDWKVRANFNLNSYALTVTKNGTGSGTVTSIPAGISCGADCTENYNAGTSVTLTAAASTGSAFAGWSNGGCSGTAATCTVTMNAARSVIATFNLAIPAAPSALSASAQANCTSVNLSWTDNSSNETGFKIERKTGAGAFTQITTTAANATTYSDTGLTKNTTYVYRIRSTNASGDSAYSSEVSVTTANDVWTPVASDVCINSTSSLTGSCGGTQPGVYVTGSKYCPPEVTAVVAQSSSAIKITWKDQSNDETKFKIQEKSGGYWTWAMQGWFSWGWVWIDNWVDVVEVASNITTYTHVGLNPSTTHTYRVAAVRSAGTGYSTNTGNATTWALAAPTLNSVTAQSATKVNLGWTDNTTDEDGFQIERGTKNWLGAYRWTTLTPNAVANAVSYQNSGLTPSTTYYYRLRTVRGPFYSAYSNIMTAASLGDPVVDLKIGDTNNLPSDTPPNVNALANLRITWSTTHESRISGLCAGTGQGWAGSKATSGDDSGGNLNNFSAGTYTYTITCNKTDGGTTRDAVTIIVKNYSITITKAGTGSGSVTPSVGALTWSGSTGTASYNAGTALTLTATASGDSNFVGWSAPCVASGTGTCTFTTVAANSAPIVATFTLKSYSFSVTKYGSGVITGNGINCGSTCSANFDHGTSVVLTATPNAGHLFDSWTGCDSTSGNTCTVNVNGAESVAATFVAKTLFVSLSASPTTGAGSLTSTLTATVTGTAVGTINYTFYCDRNDDGTNITSPNSGKYDGVVATTKTHTCTYSSVGTFYPKVIVERDSSVPNATDKKTVTVTNQPPTASNLTASSIAGSNYCTVPSHTLSWTYSDPDGDAQSKFQLQVDDDSGFGSPAIDRTEVSTVASGGSNSQQAQVAVAVMADKLRYNDTTYYWRVMVWDSYGLASSDWINGSSFKTAKHIFPTVNFKSFPTSPLMNEVVQFTDLTVGGAAMTNWSWSIPDADYQDGTNANSQNPRIKFNKTGTKNIILTVKDSDNYQCSNTDTGSSLQNVKIKLQLPGWKEQ